MLQSPNEMNEFNEGEYDLLNNFIISSNQCKECDLISNEVPHKQKEMITKTHKTLIRLELPKGQS